MDFILVSRFKRIAPFTMWSPLPSLSLLKQLNETFSVPIKKTINLPTKPITVDKNVLENKDYNYVLPQYNAAIYNKIGCILERNANFNEKFNNKRQQLNVSQYTNDNFVNEEYLKIRQIVDEEYNNVLSNNVENKQILQDFLQTTDYFEPEIQTIIRSYEPYLDSLFAAENLEMDSDNETVIVERQTDNNINLINEITASNYPSLSRLIARSANLNTIRFSSISDIEDEEQQDDTVPEYSETSNLQMAVNREESNRSPDASSPSILVSLNLNNNQLAQEVPNRTNDVDLLNEVNNNSVVRARRLRRRRRRVTPVDHF
ncbi:hypothetical protein [Orgyia leucostigma nucleopolyhedrovirus]|uniref:Uncharacterized protein Orle001 n=1 Tax=Orgyia leucostigma nucleopolyhedrovirus TaxID=490711 RepID=B0FDM3_9ABAC|nr:hypothetical protein [Orgyia leucostigma nucleopolyhedrovirus]ABY65731.1 hypothetical protein [Orgyia leucostigma nucleopolyhedrovirus]